MIEGFRTPEAEESGRQKLKNQVKLFETPLDELFTNSIRIAHENCKKPSFYVNVCSPGFEYSFDKSLNQEKNDQSMNTNQNMNDFMKSEAFLMKNSADTMHRGLSDPNGNNEQLTATQSEQKKMQFVLKNTRIYVSRKLVKQQTDLFKIAESLGAHFLCIYDESCTHFIYSGKLSDNNKELKIAKEEKKIIVSPNWVYACKEQGQHVDESLYAISVANHTSANCSGTSNTLTDINQAKSVVSKRGSVSKNSLADNINICNNNNNNNNKIIINNNEFDKDNQRIKNEMHLNEQKMQTNEETIYETNSEVFLNNEQRTDLLESENIKIGTTKETASSAVAEIPEIIPDSMDIKLMFIDQLQDKLASIKNNSINSSSKTKWSKNTSGNLQQNNNEHAGLDLESSSTGYKNNFLQQQQTKINSMDSESQLLANYNFLDGACFNTNNNNINNNTNSDETVLSEEQALNELNKSKSKWGINSGGSSGSENTMEKRKRSDMMNKTDSDINTMDNTAQNFEQDVSDAKKNLKRKASFNSLNSNLIDKNQKDLMNNLKGNSKINDNEDHSPSLLNIKTKKFTNMSPPASSQIQVTLWKEETTVLNNININNTNNSKATMNSGSRANASKKNLSTSKNITESNTKKDAIAERIIHASRASSANLNKQ
jgi:hypothetical protein